LILTTLQILPKNVGDLDKLIVAKGFKSGPKSNKSPNLVTLDKGVLKERKKELWRVVKREKER